MDWLWSKINKYAPTNAPTNAMLTAFMIGTNSRARYEISRCNRWLYANAIHISVEINSAHDLDRKITADDIFFGLEVEFSDRPRRQLVENAYLGKAEHGYTHYQCYHAMKLVECRSRVRCELGVIMCRYSPDEIIEEAISRSRVTDMDTLMCCVGVLMVRQKKKFTTAIFSRIRAVRSAELRDTMSVYGLFGACFGSAVSRSADIRTGTQISWDKVAKIIAWMPEQTQRDAFLADVSRSLSCLYAADIAKLPAGAVTDNNIRAVLCNCAHDGVNDANMALLRQLVGASPQHKLVQFATELFRRKLIMSDVVDVVMHNNEELPKLILDPDTRIGWIPRLLRHTTRTSEIIAAMPAIAVLRQAVQAHVEAGRGIYPHHHAVIMQKAAEASDEVFEMIMTLFASENVPVSVYYAGVAHAAAREDITRIQTLVSVITSR